jgi:hypothetical protein
MPPDGGGIQELHSINQSIQRSINRSGIQSIDPALNQSKRHSINRIGIGSIESSWHGSQARGPARTASVRAKNYFHFWV